MATALKISEPTKKLSKIEGQITEAIEAVAPLYNKRAPGNYWNRIGHAVSDRLGPLSLAGAIKLHRAVTAAERTVECDSAEHHGLIALGDYCIHQICVRPATSARLAAERVDFIFARMDEEDTPDNVFMATTYLPELKLAGRRIVADIRELAERPTVPTIPAPFAALLAEFNAAADDDIIDPSKTQSDEDTARAYARLTAAEDAILKAPRGSLISAYANLRVAYHREKAGADDPFMACHQITSALNSLAALLGLETAEQIQARYDAIYNRKPA